MKINNMSENIEEEERLNKIDLSGMSIITIIFEDVVKTVLDGENENEFTLCDCYNIAVENGFDKRGCIVVLVEYPLRGSVYRYGNHGDYWEEIGTLKGYA